MRIGMIILFAILYIALIALFILGYKKKQKKVWVTSLVLFLIALVATIIITSIYAWFFYDFLV